MPETLLDEVEPADAIVAEVMAYCQISSHDARELARLIIARLASLQPSVSEMRLREAADRLIDQHDEPPPDWKDARLHYWRDKAISGARSIYAALSPEGEL